MLACWRIRFTFDMYTPQNSALLDGQHLQFLERVFDAVIDTATRSRFELTPNEMMHARLAALLETMQSTLSRFQTPYVVMTMCKYCDLRSPFVLISFDNACLCLVRYLMCAANCRPNGSRLLWRPSCLPRRSLSLCEAGISSTVITRAICAVSGCTCLSSSCLG